MNPEAIINENDARRERLEAAYDPIRGTGMLPPSEGGLRRVPVLLSEQHGTVRVPEGMLEHAWVEQIQAAGSLAAWAATTGGAALRKQLPHVLQQFHRVRMQYDYEFWCATCVKIKHEGTIKPLILNPPQRKSVAIREAQRLAGQPVRQLELKHRQYGSTTEKNAYIAWCQNVLYECWDAYVISLVADGAREIVARYDTIAQHYPPEVGAITLAPYYSSQNTRYIKERECCLSIGSAERPNAPSGRTIQGALISEAGKMKSTASTGADKLITNIASMVQLQADTVLLVESTADESGTWFKREVKRAQRGESNYTFTFVSWLDDPRCQLPLCNAQGRQAFDVRAWIEGWTDYQEFLWQRGASLEQILWYQEKEKDYPASWLMQQENPTTAQEAFQVGEKRVFQPKHVEALRKTCRDPVAVGELRADALVGPEALRNITLEAHTRGRLRIWRYPGDTYGGLIEEGVRYANRYVAASDVGPGLSEKADYSVTAVLDRAPLLFGGLPEIVAEWRGHEDPDLYAWIAARLAQWYDRAYWAIEVNSYEAAKPMEQRMADFGATVIHQIKDHYRNLYMREQYDNVHRQRVTKAGWFTSRKTKPIIVSALMRAVRGSGRYAVDPDEALGYVERDDGACDELDTFLHVGGSMEAAPGHKDDRVIVRALLAHLHEEMPPVRKLDARERPRPRPVGAAAT